MRKRTQNGKVKWQADIEVNGIRKRPQFDTKAECEAFEREAKLRAMNLPAVSVARSPTPTHVAIKKYIDTISVKKDSHANEITYFKVLLEALNDPKICGADITTIDQVELFNLQSVQTFLSEKEVHTNCFKHERKAAEAEARECRETDPDRSDRIYDEWPYLAPPKQCKEDPDRCRKLVLASSTVNRYFNTVLDFFSHCKSWKLVDENPCLELEQLAINPKKKKLHSHEVTEAVIADLEMHDGLWAADVLFAMDELGQRQSTLKLVTWRDVDFRTRQIMLQSKKGKKGSMRSWPVPLTERMLERISGIYDRARKAFQARPEDFVFKSATGLPLDSKAHGRAIRKACERLGIEDYTAYCERHGLVTELKRMGVDMTTIAEIVGHTNVATTWNNYDHTDAEDLRSHVDALSKSKTKERRSGS